MLSPADGNSTPLQCQQQPSEGPTAEDINRVGRRICRRQSMGAKQRVSHHYDKKQGNTTYKSGILRIFQIPARVPDKKIPLLCGGLGLGLWCSDTKGGFFYQTEGSRIWVKVENA